MFWKDLLLKLRYIGWPYLRLLIIYLGVLSLISGVTAKAFPLLDLPSWFTSFVGPGVVAVALVVLGLWGNFRIIKETRSGKGSLGQLLTYVSTGVFACAGGSLPAYVSASLSSLRQHDHIDEALARPLERYYSFGELRTDERGMGVEQQVYTSGKNDSELNFRLLVALPIMHHGDTAARAPVRSWLGLEYHDYVSNRASATEKEGARRRFLIRSEQQFRAALQYQRPAYFERWPNDEQRIGLQTAVGHSPLYRAGIGPLLLLRPKFEPFADRARPAIQLLFWSQVVGNGMVLLLLLSLPIDDTHRQRLRAGEPIRHSMGWLGDYVKPFYWRPGYVVTPLLLNANLLIYGLMAVSAGNFMRGFSGPELLAWGANYGPAVTGGAWWRLLSAAFVHGNLLHLANNMVLLGLLGWQLEQALGGWRIAAVYLLTALGASLVSWGWHPQALSVGASGALFGWMGLGLTLLRRPQASSALKLVLSSVVLVSGAISLGLGFVLPNVDNAAHLGGLAMGASLGVVLWPWLRPALARSKESVESLAA